MQRLLLASVACLFAPWCARRRHRPVGAAGHAALPGRQLRRGEPRLLDADDPRRGARRQRHRERLRRPPRLQRRDQEAVHRAAFGGADHRPALRRDRELRPRLPGRRLRLCRHAGAAAVARGDRAAALRGDAALERARRPARDPLRRRRDARGVGLRAGDRRLRVDRQRRLGPRLRGGRGVRGPRDRAPGGAHLRLGDGHHGRQRRDARVRPGDRQLRDGAVADRDHHAAVGQPRLPDRDQRRRRCSTARCAGRTGRGGAWRRRGSSR